jgi:hypothetical protein
MWVRRHPQKTRTSICTTIHTIMSVRIRLYHTTACVSSYYHIILLYMCVWTCRQHQTTSTPSNSTAHEGTEHTKRAQREEEQGETEEGEGEEEEEEEEEEEQQQRDLGCWSSFSRRWA